MLVKKVVLWSLIILVIAAVSLFSFGPDLVARSLNRVEEHPPFGISPRAQQLHQSLIVGDWHADATLWNRDLAKHSDIGHVDIPRLQAGNVALQMFTTVTKSPSGLNYDSNEAGASDDITMLAYLQRWPMDTHNSLTARAIYQADKLLDLESRVADFSIVRSQTELKQFLARRQSNPNLVGGLIGTEGSHALDGDLANIQLLFEKGFRMMSLQHFFDNKLGGSLHGISHGGLTEFGRQAVTKMLELNIIIDVSHSSVKVVEDVLAMTDRPLVVSHTGFNGHCDSARNIDDSLMQKIADRGGLIAVGYWRGAVCGTSPKQVVGAISYGASLVGIDHISLGSDFDGSVKTGFDTSELAVLTQEMLNAGFSDAQIAKVMGGNMQRFLASQLPE